MSRKLESIQFTERSLKYFKKMDEVLLGSDLVLMLLSISPIYGTTRLQKEVFLTWKTLFEKETADLGFFPYKFGAYSKTIDDSLDVLHNSGLIQIKSKSEDATTYSITSVGKRTITRKLKDMDIGLEKLKDKKIDWDELKIRGLMRFVYRNYPEYTTKTKVPSLKW